MSQEELISYGIIAAGVLVSLYAGYKIVQKGFVLWLILIIVGITTVNYGFSNKSDISLDSFLDTLNPAKLSKMSKEQLTDMCNKIHSAKLNTFE